MNGTESVLDSLTKLNQKVESLEACIKILHRTNAPQKEIDDVKEKLIKAKLTRNRFESMIIVYSKTKS